MVSLESVFHLKAEKTTVPREVIAGLTTFFAMAYIIIVNPAILSETGMEWGAVFLATIIAAIAGTLIIGLYANVPFAQAPGMGLNTFFVYTICFVLGFTWQQALSMVFLCGILIRIMNSLGYGVRLLDKEKCCGVPLISNGLYQQALKQAKVNLGSIRRAVNEQDMDIITTSSTCTFTLRDEYPHVLSLKNDDVRDRIELATRYLYRLIQSGKVTLKFKDAKPLRVAYHTPCHMEKMGWAYYSIELLRMIPGVEVIVLDSQCCGIAGTYGFKKENYPTSQAIGEPLFRQIEASGADLVVTDCETCKWQIEMSTTKTCEHPLSILASWLA